MHADCVAAVEDAAALLEELGQFVSPNRTRAEVLPFTPAFNVTGQPAVLLPLWWNGGGLPIGVQLAGLPAGEAVLIRASFQLEQVRPWQSRRPLVAATS
jgi:amidase